MEDFPDGARRAFQSHLGGFLRSEEAYAASSGFLMHLEDAASCVWMSECPKPADLSIKGGGRGTWEWIPCEYRRPTLSSLSNWRIVTQMQFHFKKPMCKILYTCTIN